MPLLPWQTLQADDFFFPAAMSPSATASAAIDMAHNTSTTKNDLIELLPPIAQRLDHRRHPEASPGWRQFLCP
jgi:hypothetical protein